MEKKELYKFGIKLGLTKKDLESVLNYELESDEQSFISCGPFFPPYSGALYGSISVYNF